MLRDENRIEKHNLFTLFVGKAFPRGLSRSAVVNPRNRIVHALARATIVGSSCKLTFYLNWMIGQITVKTYKHGLSVALVRRLSIGLLILGLPVLGSATLGGSLESVQVDQAHFRANIRITQGAAYTVEELTTATDIVVREYVSPGGRVFGVTWRGPFIPEMRQLLGAYFQQYVLAAKAERERHVGRAPLNIQLPGLVVQTGGHMRAYFGRAYDPELLPVGTSPDDIR